MRALILALLVGTGGCVLQDDPVVFGNWRSTTYGMGGSCYTALGGETVHVAARYDGGEVEDTYDCSEESFVLSVPRGVTNVTIDVWGDSGRSAEDSTSHPLPGGPMEQNIDIGLVSVN